MKFFSALIFLTLMVACSSKRTEADTVIFGGPIYTMDEHHPVVEAVATAGDKIIYAGALPGLDAFRGSKTISIDLHDKTMTPGFIESHGHLMGLGFLGLQLDLTDVKNYDELVDRVKGVVSKATPGEWILGRGWHQGKWDKAPHLEKGFPTNELLNRISPNNPVFLVHASSHGALVNEKALEMAGISRLTIKKLLAGIQGEIITDKAGNPTGVITEQAQAIVRQQIPNPSKETVAKALNLAMDACLQNGITEFHDAGVSGATLDLYHRFKSAGKLRVRLYPMIEGAEWPLRKTWFKNGPEIDSMNWLTIRSLKLHGDGALGAHTAWLLEPYSDLKSTSGMATISMDTVLEISRQALKAGFQVCTHAIGDRTNREVLDCYEKAFLGNAGESDHRFRIEHAQHLNPDDISRFGKLHVIASMQGIHLASDWPWASERLGDKRIHEGGYVWQSILKSGARIINGTDVPVEPINPIACFYASVTRKTLSGDPPGGYQPSEKMTREQALRSYTLDAAYGAFQEKSKGSIEVGKLADFTIFSQDIMKVDEDEILKTKVSMTIVAGKVMYSSASQSP
jgi:predicted amidohydrolase YtcJ